MRQRMRILAAALALVPTVGSAADRPVTGPAPEWVQPAPAEIAAGPATDAALQVLLSDQQVRFSATATEIYVDNRILIQTPQGLQNIGTIAVAWQPDADIVTVHRLIVRRGGQVRELLGNGQDFTILRREDQLEQATLTGNLTAILQPPDLQVGDVVEFAYTHRHADPVVPDKPDLQFMWLNAPVQNVRFRASWPKQMAVRWRLRDFKPQLQESSTSSDQSIAFTLENPPPLLQPTGAPMRHAAVRRVELSAFQSWPEVSRRFAPLYADAAKLAADSPLRAETERIRKSTSDPKERAAAALRLTQEQVRYVLLAMNAGALVPATADQTWQRRYGDCKAKTVLLLALLRELGIEAEPVVVHTEMGDGIDRLLPAIGAFNHVLVRATIAGKVYWLDGTRPADRQLDRLQIPAFHWGLPLDTRGSELVRIEPAPLTEPMVAQEFSIDASAGVDAPVPFEARLTFRGDTALGLKLSLDNIDATQRDQRLRNFWRNRIADLQIGTVASNYDESAGTLTWTAAGTLQMEWDADNDYEIDGMYLGFKPDFSRPAGTDTEAPYVVAYPEYVVNRVTVKLPADNLLFGIVGKNINTTLAGWEYRRQSRILNGVFTAESVSRSLVPEIPAKEALAAEAGLREMYRDGVYLRKHEMPVAQSKPTAEELRAQAEGLRAQASEPLATPAEYVERGRKMEKAGLHDLAIADYTRAISLNAEWTIAYIERGRVYGELNRPEEARADLEKALELQPENSLALLLMADLHMTQDRYREAIEVLSTALKLQDDKQLREMRASSHEALEESELALADLEAMSRLDPADPRGYLRRAILLMGLGRPEALRALAAEVLAAPVGPENAKSLASSFYSSAGDREKALELLSEAIAGKPTADLYKNRARIFQLLRDPDRTAADLVQVLRLDPPMFAKTVNEQVELAQMVERTQALDFTLQVLDRMEVMVPGNFSIRINRGQILALMKQTDAAKEAFASARAVAKLPTDLNTLCWRQAISGTGLEDALRDCDAALAKEPDQPAFLDSRGLALLKLGRYEEAIASYDAAIANRPRQSSSLYGRGIAKLRSNRQSDGETDIDAARKIDSSVETRFELMYGLKR